MKLIKSVATIMGAGTIALAGGFAIGVTTNLVKQARAAKAEHKLRQYVAEPFTKLSTMFDLVVGGYATAVDLDHQYSKAASRIGELQEGPYKALMQSELAKVSFAIEDFKEKLLAASVATTETTQEEPAHA